MSTRVGGPPDGSRSLGLRPYLVQRSLVELPPVIRSSVVPRVEDRGQPVHLLAVSAERWMSIHLLDGEDNVLGWVDVLGGKSDRRQASNRRTNSSPS